MVDPVEVVTLDAVSRYEMERREVAGIAAGITAGIVVVLVAAVLFGVEN
tara:strand:- start:121 stop:267 length:147 start_codon:yes stop_codon:yes gene_type:complete